MNTKLAYKFVPKGISLDEHLQHREAKAKKILNILEHYLIDLKTKSLLDIGCHEGTITKFMAPSFDFAAGIDNDSDIIKVAQKLHDKRIKFTSYDGKKFPFRDNSFDVLIANHVIYYVDDPKLFISEINRVLKPGGMCYLSAINSSYVDIPLPKKISTLITKKILKSAENFGHPFSHNQYIALFNQFKIQNFTLNLLKHPGTFSSDATGWQKILLFCLSKLPTFILKRIAKLSPTYIYLLFKTN